MIRNGATPAHAGLRVVIPLNMRNGLAFCVGKGNPEYNYSAPHGVGRILSRSRARPPWTSAVLCRTSSAGVYMTTADASTLDEAPEAYKNTALISENIAPAAIMPFLEEHMRIKAVFHIDETNKWKLTIGNVRNLLKGSRTNPSTSKSSPLRWRSPSTNGWAAPIPRAEGAFRRRCQALRLPERPQRPVHQTRGTPRFRRGGADRGQGADRKAARWLRVREALAGFAMRMGASRLRRAGLSAPISGPLRGPEDIRCDPSREDAASVPRRIACAIRACRIAQTRRRL